MIRRLDGQNPVFATPGSAAPTVTSPDSPPARPDAFERTPGATLANNVPPAPSITTLETDSLEIADLARQAQASLRKAYPQSPFDAVLRYQPVSAERDELGLTHVRLQRTAGKVPVLGEQVVAHFDSSGNLLGTSGEVTKVPGFFSTPGVELSPEEAVAAALKDFGSKPDFAPTATKVIGRGSDGKLHEAYAVSAQDLGASPLPRQVQYVIDSHSGKVLDRWNLIDNLGPGAAAPKPKQAARVTPRFDRGAGWPSIASFELAKDMRLPLNHPVKLELNVKEGFPLSRVKVAFEASLVRNKDLKATITSPSGQTVTLLDGSDPGTDGSLSFSRSLAQFDSEATEGTWTLTLTNTGFSDPAVLKGGSVALLGKDTSPAPDATWDDRSFYSAQVPVGASRYAEGGWQLDDLTRGKGVETRDAQNQPANASTAEVLDDDNVWAGDKDAFGSDTAVDAQYAGQSTSDFLRDELGRAGLDNRGRGLQSVVHVGKANANAVFDGSRMLFGDGDGTRFGPMTSLDVAGHGFGVGLVAATAGLDPRGESGALRSSFGDIFGKGVEWYASARNTKVPFTWGFADRAFTPETKDDALRYFDDPTRDGSSIDNTKNLADAKDVNGLSGIPNNAFFLLANGGTNKTSQASVIGIGVEPSLRIFSRAMTEYLTPHASFADAKIATAQAARDLYGDDSDALHAVNAAWAAVGVS